MYIMYICSMFLPSFCNSDLFVSLSHVEEMKTSISSNQEIPQSHTLQTSPWNPKWFLVEN